MNKYIFPLNYKYEPKFVGIVEYKLLLPILSYASIIGLLCYIFNLDFFVSVGIIIFFTLPPLLLLSTSLNGQPPLSYFKSILMFSSKQKVYVYSKRDIISNHHFTMN